MIGTRPQRKILAQGQFIRFIKENNYEYVERVNCDGIVIIIAVTAKNKILFVEQYRLPVRKKVIEFPAGLLDKSTEQKRETLTQAAKRELWEETGYQCKKMSHIFTGPVSSGLSSDCLTIFKASELSKKGKGGGDESENITVHEVPIKTAHEWLLVMQEKGYLVDPKVYAGLYFIENL